MYFEDEDEVYKIHLYKYMAAYSTTGEVAELNPEPGQSRLRTEEVFRWLMWGIPKGWNWFFSSKYDWTHIFYDLLFDDDHQVDKSLLDQVFHPDRYQDGSPGRDPFTEIRWGSWGITYIQGSVTLTHYYTDKEGKIKGYSKFFADAWRCFADSGSFVSLLKGWQVGTPEEIALVEEWKDKRAKFSYISPDVKKYCQLEVRLLAEAVKKITVIFSELDIRPSKWYSAGSAAKALLRTHKIPADDKTDWEGYRGADRYAGAPDWIADILLRCYSGGWFENAETGIFQILHSKDLKSAYPSIIRNLPCLSHGHWEDHYVEGAVNFGHVEWEPDSDTDRRWAPFPWRFPDGRIYRPSIGQGWYCETEIRAAQRLPGYDITELGWVAFVPECDHKPFDWVQGVYDLRVQWGGDGKGRALKVTLNSVYGVFADTLNLDSRYASAIWAAMITAGTRAKILDEIADHGDHIVSVATDGILSDEPVGVCEKTTVLGQWNYEGAIYDVLLIQPGLYLAKNAPDPKKQFRNRGHGMKDMRRIETDLRDAWVENGWEAMVEYMRTRLIPGKLAITRKNVLAVYGQWDTQPVKVSFKASRRNMLPDPGERKRSVASYAHMTNPKYMDTDSAPYNRLASMLANQRLIDNREVEDAQP